jgi:enamine deaminase RidA (YjgF/YER057c/UK114 family)
MNGTAHLFVAAEPDRGTDVQQQTISALRTIQNVTQQETTRGAITQQTVFVREADDMETCRRTIEEFYADQLPATTYIHQPPCGSNRLAIEAMGVDCGSADVQVRRISDRTVITQHDGMVWVHLANIGPDAAATGVYQQASTMFQRAAQELKTNGFRYEQIARTWLYLGDIVGDEGGVQRYLELNRSRADFYQGIRFSGRGLGADDTSPIFPASTGIGTCGRGMVMSGMALATERDDLKIVRLENPLQTSAFDYGMQYGPESPRFARGLTITQDRSAVTFISGTASITDSETRFIGDVEGQTRQTLENIAQLIGEDNMQRFGLPGLGGTLHDLAIARVYVKRPQDCGVVRSICRSLLGDSPTICAVADVCRPDLLVEIEGMAFTRRR